jgi:hypothetical protein
MSCRAAFRIGLIVAFGLFGPRAIVAQRVGVTGFGVVANPRGTVLYQGVRETVGGRWLGIAVEIKVQQFSIIASGLRGTLTPIESTPFERDGGEEGLVVRFEPRSGIGAEATYTARVFSSAAGYQRWNMMGLGAWLTTALGDPALQAYVRGTYLPAVSVSGQPSPSIALGAEVGATASLRRAPVVLQVMYRFERFDFPGRFEQFERIALAVGYQFRR